MIASAVTTVAAVITTIIITVQDRRRAAGNLAAERVRSDEQLREEREHSAAQIEEERRLAREREQLSEAFAVQVFLGEKRPPAGAGGTAAKRLAAVVVNHGRYTITRVEVRFSLSGMSLISHHRSERLKLP
jgi:hypothetical protein